MNEESLTSGFVKRELPQKCPFEGLESIYISHSGYTQLFKGVRYGKFHILKTLKKEYRNIDFYEQALQKEFSIGYGLDHPNICHTTGWEDVPGIGPCILLEYIDGCNLRELNEKHVLTPVTARKVLDEICQALQYLHNRQIIHRDLKPENILIAYNGLNVKLIDFGLSDCDDYSLLKQPAGTRYYMAPETTQPGYVSNHLADIYSLGILIGEIALQLKDRQLSALSRRCTRRKPEQRYPSADTIRKALYAHPIITRLRLLILAAGLFIAVTTAAWFIISPSQNSSVPKPTYGNNHLISADSLRLKISREVNRLERHDTLEFTP